MVGNQDRWREDIFVACPLRDLVPDDYLRKLKQQLGEVEAQVESETRYEPDPDFSPPSDDSPPP